MESEAGMGELAISPDGVRLASTTRATSRIATRRLGDDKWVELPGTEGATFPFFSPDGRSIAYFTRGKLSKVAIDGGGPVLLCSAPNGRGGSWGENDTISHGAYDPDPAGNRVVALLPAENQPERPDGRLKVLLNVDAELHRRVAARGSK
jgi:hypothetical protein